MTFQQPNALQLPTFMNNATNHIPTSHARLLLLLLALVPALSWAQPTPTPPGQISYQGFLTDANGVPLALSAPKNYDVNFRIYATPTGGSAVCGEVQTVTVDRGYFSGLLGQGAALSGGEPWTNNLTGVFTGSDASDRYIGMTVKGITTPDSEIQPRLRLLASPYSLLAAKANNSVTLAGFDWSTLFPDTGNPSTGTFPGSKITLNSIGAAQIAPGAIGSVQIANGAVGPTQIANGGVGSAQIANGAVTSAQIANGAVGPTQLSLPLTLAAGTCEYLFGGPFGVLNITNNATCGGLFSYPGPGIVVGGSTAIDAFSRAGASAYIANGSDAADFYGNVNVNGTLSKTAGSFKIDHPLDPANKLLYHSFVESPDMKNIYDGIAALDSNGEAIVTLPSWFEALNGDFRYQLTAMGAPGPNLYIAQEISNNRFKIAGGAQGMKVSWQVTGIRHDAYANAHRIPVEVDKPAELRGHYISPEELGQPKSASIQTVLHPSSAVKEK